MLWSGRVRKWLAASVISDIGQAIAAGFGEAARRGPDRARTWLMLVDGNRTQIDAIHTENRTPATRLVPGPLVELAVTGVTLYYPDRNDPAARDVTLTIRTGQTVAFVGENGSGKTALAAMIVALRTPTNGTITWNGTPLHDIDPEALHARVGWSPRATTSGRSPPPTRLANCPTTMRG